jgi:excisionase family DNA binding protein
MPRIFDVVEYPNEMADRLVQRFPEQGAGDFRIGSQVIARTGQEAVFFRDGKALDTFGPGRHTITTANVPLLSGLIGAAFDGRNPFTAEVYFVKTTEMTSVGWGTRQPIAMQTPGQGLGWLLLGGHGTFGVQVTDSQTFVGRFVGAQGAFDMRSIKTRLVNAIVQSATDWFAEVNPGSLMKAQSLLDEMAAAIEVKCQDQFGALGLALKNITIGGLSPLETSAEKLQSMGLLDPQMYMQLKAMETIKESSQGGGMAGMGVGLGAGMGMGAGMGQMMAGVMSGQGQQAQGQQATPQQEQAAAPAETPEIMNVTEAANYLKVAIEDVIAMIDAGDLKAKKIGSQYRISRKAIDEFLMS